MLAWLVGGLMVGIIGYGVVPTIVIRKKRLRLFCEGTAPDCLALTFDDGPDPYYTPKLLDLLKKYGVKATFFVVGRKVERHPEIVRRMVEEGHEVGIHNYRHISNWLLPPLWLDWGVRRAAVAIEQATGQRPMYYRPPWGHFNAWTPVVQKRYTTVLWSHILGDWNEKIGAMELFRRLRAAVRGGAVIVLHDNGDALGASKRAPEQMLSALELLLKDEVAKKMRWVTITELRNAQTNKQISSM
ncbi:polysaccharide deacetylase family protein [Geobacillus thermodenitrificans]|jgi:peptidoglycan-N-acetylglucosamine deacetylase|uniref:Polysaccharide deacetylase family protein n=1 Tax=Geobacillus thermodenitrificans TaxID=33940 RepID=A0ABY9QE07_GEOTD|nr:polysaccharide deacetylase family protein [Geobacillus thermodenitrificans]ARA97968.1 polysaccharide deacetylase family protein [Geobacillus thermodenitrificans]ARP41238.1 putative 30.6 kDa protein in fumA 3'region [Geobacillus thermodenitrificans]MED3718469.1 polysaccharide deacetylase family protein [Geobacillus thermodenitrificans]PTR47840.1 polysaccharide deacetylase family protein [Geobacillus thermodenitrificans]WMV76491.1 polysaccharide deacetylase family protein [Geobacillus thermod